VELPWKIQISSLFRAQALPLYRSPNCRLTKMATAILTDVICNRPQRFFRPCFRQHGPSHRQDLIIRERFRVQGLFEFFNLFNNGNPAAYRSSKHRASVRTISQRLPGREGQSRSNA